MAKPTQPKGLRAGGKALWSALATDGMPENLVALLTEACRARDRLDQLDRVLTGDVDVWTEILYDALGEPIRLNISPVLANANQTAGVLKNLLEKIPAPAAKQAPAAGGGTALDQLAARRGQRSADGTSTTRARTAERRRPRK